MRAFLISFLILSLFFVQPIHAIVKKTTVKKTVTTKPVKKTVTKKAPSKKTLNKNVPTKKPIKKSSPRIKKNSKVITAPAKQTALSISVSLRVLGQNLSIIFSNLKTVSTINYVLSYNSNGEAQGVVGTVTPKTNSIARSLYFGTCSAGVCLAHTNIADAKLEVTVTYKNGKTQTASYPIKL